MTAPIVQVDAFTAEPFAGNPAAVCVLPEARDERWMQAVAREMNLSETAFLVRRADGAWNLRWFTPAAEVELCGHATLASAHVMWSEGYQPGGETVRFMTASGELRADRREAWIELDFPATTPVPAPAPTGLVAALGAEPVAVLASRFDFLVEVPTETDVRALAPDFRALRSLGVRGVIVTAKASTEGFDFVSRFFAPGVGIDEDPVTGSAHCALAPYWGARFGRTEMTGFQASARGGVVRVRLAGDRVILGGRAVTVLRGELIA
jgi:PhzF family phenazine biosynthesis protein